MTPARPVRVLIVDDEALARQRVEDLLGAEEGVEIVGTADSGPAAVEAIGRLEPDIVLLDVQMPGLTGLEVVREIGAERMPVTIFITAYDRFALNAFDVAAVDYLVKPFDDERFEQAFARARRAVELQELGALSSRLRALLGEAPTAGTGTGTADAPPAARRYLERIAVEMRGQVRVVPVSEIECITASGQYVELHAGGRTWLLRERMQVLEDRLDPAQFLRIHRSAIVRLDRVESMSRDEGGDYAVKLVGGRELPLSRNRVAQLERWMGL